MNLYIFRPIDSRNAYASRQFEQWLTEQEIHYVGSSNPGTKWTQQFILLDNADAAAAKLMFEDFVAAAASEDVIKFIWGNQLDEQIAILEATAGDKE